MPRRRKPRKPCRDCGAPIVDSKSAKVVRCENCSALASEAEVGMTGARLEAYLDGMVRFENAPPWVRHPKPQT